MSLVVLGYSVGVVGW